jgi:putative ABC transport system permease protein
VDRRRREIGIRIALGARGREVIHVIARQAAIAIASGVVLGLAGAMLLTRFVSSEIWEVKATDPATFAAVTLVLIGIAILACLIPARRAVGMDPNIALRHE